MPAVNIMNDSGLLMNELCCRKQKLFCNDLPFLLREKRFQINICLGKSDHQYRFIQRLMHDSSLAGMVSMRFKFMVIPGIPEQILLCILQILLILEQTVEDCGISNGTRNGVVSEGTPAFIIQLSSIHFPALRAVMFLGLVRVEAQPLSIGFAEIVMIPAGDSQRRMFKICP